MLTIAFKPASDLSSFWMPPTEVYWGNFVDAWLHAKLVNAFLNNVLITLVTVVAVVGLGAFAAYPLARFKTRLNRVILLVFIACQFVPPLSVLVPLYILIVGLFGSSTYPSIILPHIAYQLPVTIFLFTSFISTIPRELDEAAWLDGCHRMGIFFRIIFPTLKPVTSTVIILVGSNVWNDYAFSTFFLQRPSMQNLAVALSSFFNQFSNQVNWVAAGSLIGVLPITAAYLALQKYFVKGMTAGAVKG
jgi:raffinose/stachyose/melibiose transport system permease protein